MAVKIVDVRGLKKGNYVVIDDEPCKIINMTSSKPGKHGAAKVRMDAASIFDNKKHSLLTSGSDKIEVPIINKQTHQVLSINGNIAQLMNTESYETLELEIPEELTDTVVEGGEVQVMEALDRKQIME
jgi:translation initiation factor 5A